MKFEDLHAAFPGNYDYYAVPNERLDIWDRLLQGLRVSRAAGICSGGEVGFFNLLPHVRRELVLIDHSYKSLYIAMVKYAVMEKYGAEEAHKRLTSAGLGELATEVSVSLPACVVNGWKDPARYGQKPDEYQFERKGGTSIPRAWKRLPGKTVVKTCTHLDKIVFAHGDLTDLAAKGPFGLLYLSNALHHTSRTRTSPVVKAVAQAVRPGGYVLTSRSPHYLDKTPQEWEKVNEVVLERRERMTPDEIRWTYSLYQTAA